MSPRGRDRRPRRRQRPRAAAPGGCVRPTPPPAAPTDEIQWFLALEGVQKGPFPRKVLVDRLAALAPKDSDVHVWNDTLDGWRPPAEVPQIARELQARLRQAPSSPPPPPVPRLRPVPAPPSHAHAHASSQAGSHSPAPLPVGRGHGAAAVSPAHAAHGASSHGGALAPNGHGAVAAAHHSGLSLGLASVAPAVAPVPTIAPAGMLDTPVPIRELVQAHKAQNGADGHGVRVGAGRRCAQRARERRVGRAADAEPGRWLAAARGAARAVRRADSRRRRSPPRPARGRGSAR